MKAVFLEAKSCLILLMTIISSTKVLNENVRVGGNTLSRGADKGMAYAKYKTNKFSYLNITSIGSDYVLKGSECALACVDIPSCFSFNLAAVHDINGKVMCELLPSDMYNNSDKFLTNKHFHYYSIRSPCMSWPCQNNGTCFAKYEKNSYVCVCSKEFTGEHCGIDIDECIRNPCLNEGTCVNQVNGYSCTCKRGYKGATCQIEPTSVIICEGDTQSITCSSGSTLDILDAMYGRQDSNTCAGIYQTTDCRALNSYSAVYNRCQSKGSCLLKASNNWFDDPCKGTRKYLFVKYHCMA